jgi:adhesin/invasin
MAGVSVHFVADRGGSADPAYATTNAEGIASSTWTLGAMPGRQRLSATCAELDSAAVLIAEAEPTAANTRVTPVGYPWSGVAGSVVPLKVSVQLTDSTGRLLPGVPVTWVALDSGSITTLEARTDSLGESHASWRLSRRAGLQRARVRVGTGRNVPVAPVLATGIAGPPALLLGGDGNAQKGVAGEALRRAISVELRDEAGNPVEGAAVAASVLAGKLADSVAITDSNGVASFRWTLGPKAGRQQMVVRAGGLPPLTATVLAAPGSPANIEFVSPPMSGAAGKPLSRPIRLVITDVHGNRVTERQVTLSATSGSLSPARAMPAPDGSVTAKWRLGSKRGVQVLTAEVRGTAVRAKTEVTVR